MRISSCIVPGESVSIDIEGISMDFDVVSFREFVSRMNAILRNVEDFQSILERDSECPECGAVRRSDGVIKVSLPDGFAVEMRVIHPEVDS